MSIVAISILLMVCALVGVLIGWFMSQRSVGEYRKAIVAKDTSIEALRLELSVANQTRVQVETKLEEKEKSFDAERKILADSESRLAQTFQALSGESLKSNNRAFLDIAQESMKGTVGSLGETLKRYEVQLRELEKRRATDYGSLENQISSLAGANKDLRDETGNLVSALRRPEVRGRWGEVTLKRVVELAGMVEHCDFSEQVSVSTESGLVRPDMIVNLPSNRQVVVDSKISLNAYMDAIAAEGDERKALMAKHAQQLRRHMRDLAAKGYWEQFDEAPEFVVMFIAGESFLSSALEYDHQLIEDGMESRVIIATPTTLIALLRAVAYGWRQEQVTKNAQEIAVLGKQLYERFASFMGHFSKMRQSLEQSVFNFNRLLGSLEGRVLPSILKFKELGATGKDEIPTVDSIDQGLKEVQELKKPKPAKKKKKESLIA